MLTALCPKCGGADIRERNVAATRLPVIGWEVEDGELRPTEYGDDTGPEWECEDTDNPYTCGRCDWEGQLGALIVADAQEHRHP